MHEMDAQNSSIMLFKYCRSVQRTSILDVPEDEETAAAEGVEEVTNEIENKNEPDETWMFYTAMQPIQQLWYYLVPSS